MMSRTRLIRLEQKLGIRSRLQDLTDEELDEAIEDCCRRLRAVGEEPAEVAGPVLAAFIAHPLT